MPIVLQSFRSTMLNIRYHCLMSLIIGKFNHLTILYIILKIFIRTLGLPRGTREFRFGVNVPYGV